MSLDSSSFYEGLRVAAMLGREPRNPYLQKQKVGSFENLSAVSVAVRRREMTRKADRVYIGYIENGVAKVASAAPSLYITSQRWIQEPFEAEADDICVAFNGHENRNGKYGKEFITDSSPWIFWTKNGVCKGRILGLLGETIFANENCTKVTAICDLSKDNYSDYLGFVLFMVIDGKIYYRQLLNNNWTDAELVQFGPSGVTWADISAFRTWDYRVCLQAITTTGDVYELFSKYQGLNKYLAEHIYIPNVVVQSELKRIYYTDTKCDDHLSIVTASFGALYGGLYRIGTPVLLQVYNIDDGNGDWGKRLVLVFDRHLLASDVSEQYSTFSITDSRNMTFTASGASLGSDGKTITLIFENFNAAYGSCYAIYAPGTIKTMAGDSLSAYIFQFVPENLVSPSVPIPEVYRILNGGIIDFKNRVRFYNTPGTVLYNTEYVTNGDDCIYGSDEVWTTIINSGLAIPNITKNIQDDINLFLARWTVNFYSTNGQDLLCTEYVKNGEDCKYGTFESLLIASNSADILIENKGEDYISGSSTWGGITFVGSGQSKVDDKVAFTTAGYGTFDLSKVNQSITAYVVVQQYGSTSGSQCLLYAAYANSTGNAPGFFSNNGTLFSSYYSSDVNLGIIATEMHILTLKIDSSKHAYYYVDGVLKDTKTINNSGAQIQIAALLNNNYSANAYYYYVAVVDGAEDESVIFQNCAYIKDYYFSNVRSYEWAISENNGIAVPEITEDILSNMSLYLARWTVTYYRKDGSEIKYIEYVKDGEDAVLGADQEWSDTAGGSAVSGILENIHSNKEVYAISDFWARDDSYVYDAQTILLTHSGSRQPAIKTNDGEAAGIFCYNCGGNGYGGNWFGLYLIGKTAADCAFSCPTSGTGSFVYNGNTYYFSMVGMNRNWGGATVYDNPIGFPEMHDVQTFVVNGALITAAGAQAIGDLLQLE